MPSFRKATRLFIIIVTIFALALVVRELFLFREVSQNVLFAKVELPELIAQSSLIVQGRVERRTGTVRYWNNQGELAVDTRWRIVIDEVFKGESLDQLVVRSDGGRYLLTHIDVQPTVSFTKNEEALLFLKPIPDSNDYTIVGSFQGHFTIEGDQVIQQETGERKTLSEFEATLGLN